MILRDGRSEALLKYGKSQLHVLKLAMLFLLAVSSFLGFGTFYRIAHTRGPLKRKHPGFDICVVPTGENIFQYKYIISKILHQCKSLQLCFFYQIMLCNMQLRDLVQNNVLYNI